MAFSESVVEGWYLFKNSLRVLRHKPVLLAPIFLSWIVVTTINVCVWYFLYAGWHRSEAEPSERLVLLCVYCHVFVVSLIICIANIMMLEFMQQMESRQKISFSKALKEAVILDLVKTIPLAAVWAALWLLISILKCIVRKRKGRGAGSSDFILNRIQQAIRMAVFLALPAIAWENKGPFSSIAQSVRIIRKHSIEFLTTYTLTALTSILLAIPLLIILILSKAVTFPTAFWAGVIIYVGFVWSLGIYMEQMSLGLLYLWHLRWVESGSKKQLSSVPEPDLLDEVYELEYVTFQMPADGPEEADETDKWQLKFRTACKQALADGRLSVDEKYDLKKLGKSLNMPGQDMKRIFTEEKSIFRTSRQTGLNPNVELQFRKMCKESLADGKVTSEEKRQLKSLAEFFNLPSDIVRQILAEEIKDLPRRN